MDEPFHPDLMSRICLYYDWETGRTVELQIGFGLSRNRQLLFATRPWSNQGDAWSLEGGKIEKVKQKFLGFFGNRLIFFDGRFERDFQNSGLPEFHFEMHDYRTLIDLLSEWDEARAKGAEPDNEADVGDPEDDAYYVIGLASVLDALLSYGHKVLNNVPVDEREFNSELDMIAITSLGY